MRGRSRGPVVWVDDVELLLVKETELAYGVKQTETDDLVWLPKSQTKLADTYGEYIMVSLPDWLVKVKNLKGAVK